MSELRMAVIFRADLPLPPGKMAAQAGHAFLMAFVLARLDTPAKADMTRAYIAGDQTKIVLLAPDVAALESIAEKARARGVPVVLIRDAGRTVVAPRTVTCLGLGPMTKTDYNALTRGLALL